VNVSVSSRYLELAKELTQDIMLGRIEVGTIAREAFKYWHVLDLPVQKSF
jgi:hypothetical protein